MARWTWPTDIRTSAPIFSTRRQTCSALATASLWSRAAPPATTVVRANRATREEEWRELIDFYNPPYNR